MAFEFGPIQTAWLEALESGKYKQGQGCLRSQAEITSNDGAKTQLAYCCLGVLCEVAGLPWQERKADSSPDIYTGYVFQGEASNGYLPTKYAETVGLSGPKGAFKQKAQVAGGYGYSLAELNDALALPFAEIAAYIRAQPENVFTHAA